MWRSSTSQDRPHRTFWAIFAFTLQRTRGDVQDTFPSHRCTYYHYLIDIDILRIDVTHHAVWPRRTCTHSKNDALIQHTQTTTRQTLPRQQHIHISNTCEYQQHAWHEGILSSIIHVTHHVTNLTSYYSIFHSTLTLGQYHPTLLSL
jgi:hypothetical protein